MGLYGQYVFPRICDWLLNKPMIRQLRRELLVHARGNILEIGFGTGLNLPCYPEHVKKLTTVDPNAGMNRRAQRRIAGSGIEVE